jgi:hypothetical protein
MWQGFTIALREGIEAFLIIALTLSYLKRTGREALARAVYWGAAVSVITCTAAGFLFSKATNQSLWEGILALTAAILVGSLLLYMKRISKSLKSDLENRLETRAGAGTGNRALWGVFAFTVLMITREGMETALLIATALFQLKSSAVFLGLALGLVDPIRARRGSARSLERLGGLSGDLSRAAPALQRARVLGSAAPACLAGDSRRDGDPRPRRQDRAPARLFARGDSDPLARGALVEAAAAERRLVRVWPTP